MEGTNKKAQVVIAARSPEGPWSFLIFKTNKSRGEFWQNVTGSADKGESFEEAALREALEESAFELEDLIEMIPLKLQFQFLDRWKKNVTEECFLIIVEKQFKPTLDPKEHLDWKWISANDVSPEVVYWPTNFEALNRSIQILGRSNL